MPSATELSIRDKVEALALAWFTTQLAVHVAATPADAALWAPVEAKRRKEQTDRKFPRVVFDATRAPEDEAVEGLYRVELQIYLGTLAEERPLPAGVPNSETAQARRCGLLEEIFGYGKKDAFRAWSAAPACPVKGVQLYDIFVEEGMGDQTERHWLDQINYTVVAALRDEA